VGFLPVQNPYKRKVRDSFGERELLPGVGRCRPETLSRFPPPAPNVDLLLLKIQRYDVIGVDIFRTFLPINTARSDQHIRVSGIRTSQFGFQSVGMTMKMHEFITVHHGFIFDFFGFAEPVRRVVGEQEYQFLLFRSQGLFMEISFLQLTFSHADFIAIAVGFEAEQGGIEPNDAHRKIFQSPGIPGLWFPAAVFRAGVGKTGSKLACPLSPLTRGLPDNSQFISISEPL
jgi:hypothetical protein